MYSGNKPPLKTPVKSYHSMQVSKVYCWLFYIDEVLVEVWRGCKPTNYTFDEPQEPNVAQFTQSCAADLCNTSGVGKNAGKSPAYFFRNYHNQFQPTNSTIYHILL